MVNVKVAGDVLLTCVVWCSNGWIHTLLEEAENERMHLLTFLTLKEKNNLIFRTMVIGGQVRMPTCPLLHPRPCPGTQDHTEGFVSLDRASAASWLWNKWLVQCRLRG